MGLVFKNNAKTTLSSGVNDSTTTIPVTDGSVFPVADATAGTFFFATLDDDTNNEIVKVTASNGSSGNQNLTVVRAQENTTARAFSSGDKVELRLTAGMVDTFNLSGNDITLSSNKVGFGDSTPEVSLDLGSQTDSLHVPVGTTAQRPGSPEAGYLRYNSTTGKFEGYTNAWGDLADGSDFLVTNTFTTANASTTAFTISNAVQDEKQLLVFIDGVFQAHNSYSVSGTTVTLSTAPASGREVTIYSALSNLQGANMVIATMTGDNSDTTLDLGVTPISENNVQVYFDGVYQHKSTFSISGQILTFSTAPPTGVAVEAITHTVLDISAAASSVLIDEFTGNGSTTAFTLSAAPANENNTQVYVAGVYQEKATYSVSGTTLTLTEAPANGVSIEVMSIAVGQINSAIQLSDADGDTKVQVEESSDEDKIRFDTAGSERMVIDSSSVLIGSSTSIASNIGLQITGTDAAGFISLFRDDSSVVADDDLGGILFYGDDNNATTQFASIRATAEGTHADGDNPTALRFLTTSDGAELSAERMRIFASGDVGFNTTTINTGTLGPNNTFLEVAAGTNSGSGTIILSRNTSANNVELGGVRFVNANNADDDGLDSDGKLVAAVSARSVTSDSNAGDDSGADLIFYTKPEAGNYAERARILSSGGLTFNGDTATANALDDYEEGTWTPSSSSNGTVSNAQGFYVKIGKLVHVLFYFSLSGVSTSTSVNVAGLPYAVQDNIGPSNVGGTQAIFGDLTNFLAFAQEASSLLTIEYDRPLSGTAATSANLRGSVTYMTAL